MSFNSTNFLHQSLKAFSCNIFFDKKEEIIVKRPCSVIQPPHFFGVSVLNEDLHFCKNKRPEHVLWVELCTPSPTYPLPNSLAGVLSPQSVTLFGDKVVAGVIS